MCQTFFTEFGSFTVGESGGAIYKILYQNNKDREMEHD
jgi:arginine decarboxylase